MRNRHKRVVAAFIYKAKMADKKEYQNKESVIDRPLARKDWNVNWFCNVPLGCSDALKDCIGVNLERTIWMLKTNTSRIFNVVLFK